MSLMARPARALLPIFLLLMNFRLLSAIQITLELQNLRELSIKFGLLSGAFLSGTCEQIKCRLSLHFSSFLQLQALIKMFPNSSDSAMLPNIPELTHSHTLL